MEASGVFRLLDVDESGTIDLEEFLNGCLGLHGPAKAIDLATLMWEVRQLSRGFCDKMMSMEDRLHLVLNILNTGKCSSLHSASSNDLGKVEMKEARPRRLSRVAAHYSSVSPKSSASAEIFCDSAPQRSGSKRPSLIDKDDRI